MNREGNGGEGRKVKAERRKGKDGKNETRKRRLKREGIFTEMTDRKKN